MRLKVIHENGAIETLTIQNGDWRCVDGKVMNRLQGNGMEHFFTTDGYYDGWGGGVSATPAEAEDVIAAMEDKREIASPD